MIRLQTTLILFLLPLLLVLAAVPALADRVVLNNGREIRGTIVEETKHEYVIDIGDGMKVSIRKAAVASIERTPSGPAEKETQPGPSVEPAPGPAPKDDPAPGPKRPTKPSPDGRGTTDFFAGTPEGAWNAQFGRYPELIGAKLTRYRAYELVERADQTVDSPDDRFRDHVLRHGHGGSLSRWKFRYVGVRELRHGHRVKFVGVITAPPATDPPLIALDGGPTMTTTRIVVVLVKGEKGIDRYATTTVFTNRDFRVSTIRDLSKQVAPVRTYTDDYGLVGTTWLTPGRSEFLSGIFSPFGDTPRARIERYRFRVAYFQLPPSKRPGLDPDLLRKNAVRPLAREGVNPASAEYVTKLWGSDKLARERLAKEVEALRRSLASIGVESGRGWYVEEDRIGLFGDKGVTIETRRYRFPKADLETLLQPK